MPRRSRRTTRRTTAARTLIALLASTGLLGVVAPSAVADACTAGTTTKTWTGAAGDGFWSTAGNWSPAGVPANTASVCLPANTPAVTINSPATVASLAAATPITLSAGSLTLTGAESNTSSTFTIGGGDLAGASSLRVLSGGALNWASGNAMNGPAAGLSQTIVDPGATLSITGSQQKTLGNRRQLVINGAATWADGSTISAGQFSNVDVGGTLTFTGDQAMLYDSSGGTNKPQLRVLAGGKLLEDAPASSAISYVHLPVLNQGTIEAAKGTTVFSGGTATPPVGTTNSGAWSSTGGTNSLTGGTFTLNGATVTGTGTGLRVAGATLEVPTAGAVSVDPTATAALASNGILTGAGAFNVSGTLTWDDGGQQKGTGLTEVLTGGSLKLVQSNPLIGYGGRTLDARTVRIASGGTGVYQGTADTYFYGVGKLEVGGELDLQTDDGAFIDQVGTGARAVRVLAGGLLKKTTGGGTGFASSALNSVPLENDGTVEAVDGDLAFTGGGTGVSAGTFKAAAGRSVELGGNGLPSFDVNGASATGAGTLRVRAGTLNLPTGAVMSVDNGTTLALAPGGILTGPGTANVSGALTWDDGAQQKGTGLTEVQSGGQLNFVQSNPANVYGGRTLEGRTVRLASGGTGVYEGNADTYFYAGGKLEVGGTLELKTDDGAFTDQVGSGTRAVRVLAGGVLKKTNGGAGFVTSRNNSVPLENDGTVEAVDGDLAFSGGGSGVSAGTFKAASGRYVELGGNGLPSFDADGASVAGAGTVRVASGTLNLPTAASVLTTAAGSTLAIAAGGILTGPGTANVSGTLAWDDGGQQKGAGLTEVKSGGQLDFVQSSPASGYGGRSLEGRTVRLASGGSGVYAGTADTYFYAGGKLEIGGTLELKADSDAFVDQVGSGSRALRVLAGGVLKKTNGGAGFVTSRNNSVPLENDGTVEAVDGDLAFSGGGTGVSAGTFKAASGRYVELGGSGLPSFDANGASVAGAGTVRVVNGTVNLPTGGAMSVDSGGTLTLGPAGALTGPGTANVSGTLAWDDGGLQKGTGLTEIKSGGQLKLFQSNASQGYGGRTLEGRTVRLASGSTGVYEAAPDTFFYEGGKLEIAGTLDLKTDNSAFVDQVGSGTRALRVLPGGVLKKTTGGVGFVSSANNSVPLENDGTVEAATGDLEFNQGGTGASSGTWKAAAGRHVRLNTGAYDIDGGSVEGPGELRLISGAKLNVLDTKTLTVASGGVLEQDYDSFLSGPGTVAVAGLLDWGTGSTMNGTGITKVLAGGSLITSRSRSTFGTWRGLDQRLIRVDEGATATLGRPISAGYSQGEAGQIGQSNGGRIDVAGTLNLAAANNGGSSPNVFEYSVPGGIKILSTGTLARTSTGNVLVDVPVDNAGTVSAPTGTIELMRATTGWNAATSTLNGGTFSAAGTGHLLLWNVNVQKLGAKVVLDGANSKITSDNSTSALAGLNAINATGGLTLRNGRNLTTPAGLTNNGLVALAASKLSVTGTYTQSSTGTYQPTVSGTGTAPLQFGQLAATAKATLGGKLEAAVGAGYTPVLRDKVDTITAGTGVNAPTWTETTQDPLRPRYDANAVKLIADIEAPVVTVGSTTPRALTNDAGPAFAGTAGTKEGDAATVQLALFKSTDPATDLLPANSTATVTGGNWTFSSATPALESGATYTLRVRQSDDVKNVGEVTKTFVVDRVEPTPSIAAASPKPRTNVQTPAVGGVGGSATGDDAEVKVALFSGSTPDPANEIIADTVVPLGAGSAFSFADASKTLPEGTYTWRVKQADAATNVGTVTKTFVVDRTLPTPAIDADKPAARTKTATPSFAGPAGVDTGDNGTVELDLFSGAAATGTDRLPTATATVSGGRWTFTAATPVLLDGQYTLRVRQGDEAGNEGAVTRTFVVDTKKPTPTITSPASAGQRLKTKIPMFSGTGTRAVGDKAFVSVTITGTPAGGTAITPLTAAPAVNQTTGGWTYSPSPVLKDGSYTLKVSQSDDVDNTLEITRTFVVDNLGPALTLDDLPKSPTNVNTIQASGTGGRAVGDLPTVDIDVFAGSTPAGTDLAGTATAPVNATTGKWSYAAPTTLPDGVYTYRATQKDSAVGGATPGNPTVKTRTITIDTVKPTIAANALTVTTGAGGTPIEEGATTTSKTARFSFAASEASTFKCKLELGGAAGTLETCTSPLDVSGLADGTYKFTVVATDLAGNDQATPSERTFSVVRGVNVAAGVLSYDAGAADDNVGVRSESVGGVPSFVIKNTEVASVPAGEGCTQLTAIEAACPAAQITKISVGTGAGADRVNAPVAMALELNGGPGDDRLSGGSAADTLIGGDNDDLLDGRLGGDTMTGNAGTDTVTYAQRTTPVNLSFDGVRNDGAGCPGASCENDALGTAGTSDVEIVFGGQGADTISGAAGVDKLNGGPGNDKLDAKGGDDVLSGNGGDDTLIGGPGPGTSDNDVVNGGDGTDLADYSARTTTAVSVTLDDVANDGRPVSTVPAEKDDVRTDVENVTGGGVADTITGSARENVLNGGAGNDLLDGGAGADVLDGGIGIDQVSYALRTVGVTVDLSGSDAAREADAGNADDEAGDGRRDLVLAMEGARGGSARDLLTAGTLAGGTWAGNGGADRIEVRNAKADTVNCGTEADVVVADAGTLDTIDASCEPAGIQKP